MILKFATKRNQNGNRTFVYCNSPLLIDRKERKVKIMMYYKVPAYLQDKPCYKPNTTRRIPNGYYLIANELLTISECKRINAPIDLLIQVTVKKTECYIMFGARFEIKKGTK